jgi:hypothetical protein
MSRFANIIATNVTINNLAVDTITTSTKSNIGVNNGIDMNYNSITNLKSINLNNIIDIVYDSNKNTAAVKLKEGGYKGVLYDTNFNRPFEQILPISQEYVIPDNNTDLILAITQQPAKVYLVNPLAGNQTFELPALEPIIENQNIHLRFSNTNISNLINFTYNGENIIQIGYERASFIWYTEDGINYYWRYIT